jgi:hypothetical protein
MPGGLRVFALEETGFCLEFERLEDARFAYQD